MLDANIKYCYNINICYSYYIDRDTVIIFVFHFQLVNIIIKVLQRYHDHPAMLIPASYVSSSPQAPFSTHRHTMCAQSH